MGFRANCYAKVWEKRNNFGHEYEAYSISISRKDKTTGTYMASFKDIARFAGNAFNKAHDLQKGQSIKILECDVTNRYDPEKKVTYYNFIIYDFVLEPPRDGGQPVQQPAQQPIQEPSETGTDDDLLPF